MVQFNKMFVMLPVMFAARRLDGDDQQTVYWLRIAYGVVQTLCVLAVVYTYLQASTVATLSHIVYVPPAPQVSVSIVLRACLRVNCCCHVKKNG